MDLQNVRTLAHRLYCQCQEPASSYKAVAKSVRNLRNRLEEADEALSGTSFGPEDIRVLEAAGESKNVLNKLETAVQREDAPAADGVEPEDTAADFIAQFSVVIRKLAKALQDQEQVSGRADLLLAETKRSPESHGAASTASGEYNRGLSRDTSVRSSTTTTSQSSYDQPRLSPEPAKLPAIAEQRVPMPDSALERGTAEQTYAPRSPHSASTSPAFTLSPDLRTRDPRFDAPAARAGPDPLLRAYSDPNQLTHAEAWRLRNMSYDTLVPQQLAMPAHDYRPAPPLQQYLPSYPGPPPPTILPLRPRYYVSNPDSGYPQPVELPGDEKHTMSGGVYPAPPTMPPQAPYPIPQQQHPALRDPYGSSQPYEQVYQALYPVPPQQHPALRDPYGRPYDHRPGTADTGAPSDYNKELGASQLRNPLTRTESTSSEALPLDMRSDPGLSPTMAGHATPTAKAPLAMRPEPGLGLSMAANPAPKSNAGSTLGPAQINDAIRQWNDSNWSQAEACLQDCHRRAMNARDHQLARRMQHLLGVVASIQGHWQRALTILISVLRAAIVDDTTLDDGDCAAAYWLGDTYCLLNRRAEALAAYLVAEHSSLFRGTQIRQRILVEQKACIPLAKKSNINEWNTSWEREAKKVDRSSPDSILRPQTLARVAEQKLLDRARLRTEAKKDAQNSHILDQNHSRVMAFRVLGADAGSYDTDYQLRIGPSAFDTSADWPLPFDPYFAMANVVRGRLVTDECDLLSLIKLDSALSMPKAGRKKGTYFIHHDLQWLIVNIRACLKAADMHVTETASATEWGFIARQQTFSGAGAQGKGRGIATLNFVTITLSRQSSSFGKSGFMVDIASQGLYSARILRGDWTFNLGVSTAESDRLRNSILEQLNNALKHRDASLRANGIGSNPLGGHVIAHKPSVERFGMGARKGPFSLSSGASGSLGSRPESVASR